MKLRIATAWSVALQEFLYPMLKQGVEASLQVFFRIYPIAFMIF